MDQYYLVKLLVDGRFKISVLQGSMECSFTRVRGLEIKLSYSRTRLGLMDGKFNMQKLWNTLRDYTCLTISEGILVLELLYMAHVKWKSLPGIVGDLIQVTGHLDIH